MEDRKDEGESPQSAREDRENRGVTPETSTNRDDASSPQSSTIAAPSESESAEDDDEPHNEGDDREERANEDASEAGDSMQPVVPPVHFDIFEFVRNIKSPPLQKEVITHFDEAAAAIPHQILRSIFTFIRSQPRQDGAEGAEAGPSEADKILVLNMGHELLFAYFDEQVEPPGEDEQQLALDALKIVYQSSNGESMTYRRELNNVVSLIWKLSDEIDIGGSDRQVDNFAQLLRYCLNPATHTAANTQEERYQLAELGLTLFLRIMHELVRSLMYLFAAC